jgi:hypothetical protein
MTVNGRIMNEIEANVVDVLQRVIRMFASVI